MWSGRKPTKGKKYSEINIQVQNIFVASEYHHTIVFHGFCKEFTKILPTSFH